MLVITAPNRPMIGPSKYKIFLAGGITGCFNWHEDIINKLGELELGLILFNPRRENFDITKVEMSIQQIKWEHDYLDEAKLVIFWFASETLCPITLFELGTVLKSNKDVIVGIHKDYKRKFDLEIQIPLYRKDVSIVHSIDEIVDCIEKWSC